MTEKSLKELNPIQITLDKRSRLLQLKQGENVVRITRDCVNKLEKLRKGELKDIGGKTLNSFTTKLVPLNRCVLAENGYISISCKDEWEDNVVIIANHKKLDDLQRIIDFVDKNKTRIAWDRDFKGKY